MKTSLVAVMIVLLFTIILSQIAKRYTKKILDDRDELDNDDYDAVFEIPTPVSEEKEIVLKEGEAIINTKDADENKVVLDVQNCPSTSNPRYTDYNDVQNLNHKYNKNTYRATNGRFKSAVKTENA